MVKQLLSTLLELVEIHGTLNELADQKNTYLINQDVSKLEQVVRAENKLVHRLQVLEGIRTKQVSQLLTPFEIPLVDQTMTTLLEQLEGEDKKQLLYSSDQLVLQVQQLKQKNEQNQLLIKDALQFIHVSIDALMPQEDYQYTGKQDEMATTPGRSLFDSKA